MTLRAVATLFVATSCVQINRFAAFWIGISIVLVLPRISAAISAPTRRFARVREIVVSPEERRGAKIFRVASAYVPTTRHVVAERGMHPASLQPVIFVA